MKCTARSNLARSTKQHSSLAVAASLTAASLLVLATAARGDTSYYFGYNEAGEADNGKSGYGVSTLNSPLSPSLMLGFDGKVTAVTAGGLHSIIVDNGALYGVGNDQYGQLGDGKTYTYSGSGPVNINISPIPALLLTSGVTSVDSGSFFTAAIANGAVYTFGNNIGGPLGNGGNNNNTSVPTLTANPALNSGVSTIAAGRENMLAIKNGALYSWGQNGFGQIGDGTLDTDANGPNPNTSNHDALIPELITSMSSGVTAIASGYYTSLAVKAGVAYAWGLNQNGQTGNNTNTGPAGYFLTPTPVLGLPSGLPVSAVAAGQSHSLALVTGTVYAFGDNNYGQLGNGSDSESVNATPTAPTNITGFITNVQTISSSSYALDADGSLWVWGRNDIGELGLGNYTQEDSPTHLLPPGGRVFTSIDTGAGSDGVVVTTAVAPSKWTGLPAGIWNDSTQWTSGVPNAVDAGVYLPAVTAPTTILTTTPITIGNLSFNSATSYMIGGTGSITISATPGISVSGAVINDYVGNHTVAPATLEFAANTQLNVTYGVTLTLGSVIGNVVIDSNMSVTETGYGAVAFTSTVALNSGASLNLNSPTTINTLTLGANATTSVAAHTFYSNNALTLSGLTLSPTSKLDLSNNESIIHNGNVPAIYASLATGYNSGAWNGSGIVSTTAASDSTHLTAVGFLQATAAMNVSGQSLVAGDVLVKYTYYGDADLSGFVDSSDYSRIDNGFVQHLTGWNNGDFNYDGVVNGSDYTLIDNTFNTQGAAISSELASPTAQIAGTAAVPETNERCVAGYWSGWLAGPALPPPLNT